MMLGLGLTAAALREAVPGTTLSRRALGATRDRVPRDRRRHLDHRLVSPTTLAGFDVGSSGSVLRERC